MLKAITRERLVTIKGSVGIGKTALARAVARYMDCRESWRRMFADGVYFVQLQASRACCDIVWGL